MTNLDTASTASLILTMLVTDDAMTARELAAATGLGTAQLRPALCLLRATGDLVTSGRGAGTRYVLALEEKQPVALVVSEAVQQQRAERSSTAGLVLADELGTRVTRRARTARPAIPATVDVMAALEQTAERLAAGATLHDLSARPPHAALVASSIEPHAGQDAG